MEIQTESEQPLEEHVQSIKEHLLYQEQHSQITSMKNGAIRHDNNSTYKINKHALFPRRSY